ncbi:glycosyltransferase family 2 protein [Neptunomonas qingdaonensis]|uniref:Glycosyltransferase involved in cell wall bisynthesis n=1 Tax=Neptunomonas qingdaonensis TaxID=1045558 RepID=A0A1I2VUT6_9GAMM|nr:glycosyltransferase family 2 protein [Neptunomonas qingdaonensis]SFG92219.1 Glycosyltransferase involved in cell wall bisynthesis [Neptunomonas qingdaonensis]
MSLSKPFVSIVIATYNAASTLKRAIDSVASQKFEYIELIIIDGGSTDETASIVNNKSKGIVDYFVSEPDSGIHEAWNKGVKASNGEWIYFLGADDCLKDENVIQRFYNEQKNKTGKLFYATVQMKDKEWLDLDLVGKPWGEVNQIFATAENCVPHQSVFHHIELFNKYGFFDQSLKIAGDYDFLFRCYINGIVPQFIEDFIVADMQDGGVSNDKRSRLTTYREFGFVRKKYGARVYTRRYIVLLLKGYFWLVFPRVI